MIIIISKYKDHRLHGSGTQSTIVPSRLLFTCDELFMSGCGTFPLIVTYPPPDLRPFAQILHSTVPKTKMTTTHPIQSAQGSHSGRPLLFRGLLVETDKSLLPLPIPPKQLLLSPMASPLNSYSESTKTFRISNAKRIILSLRSSPKHLTGNRAYL